jgi:2-polyprenyl-3-methyl-5-hydroxy-6-metoxy-1,4-benzoquinol methylase
MSILDTRDEPAFRSAHSPGSGNVPVAELDERRAELPARDVPVLVVSETASDALAAGARLHAMGFEQVVVLDDSWRALAPHPESGAGARLWRPAPLLAAILPRLPIGRALDVAAGAGRDAVTLALHGLTVEAWDIDGEALARAAALARRSGVAIETRVCDLEDPGVEIPAAAYQVVTCFRFLHRPLLPKLAAAVAPGGVILCETFRVGQERFGKPKRAQFLLEPGELGRAFTAFEVLLDEEPDPPEGPIVSRFVGRKPG